MPASESITDPVRVNTKLTGRSASIARQLKERLGVSYKALLIVALEALHEKTVETDIKAAQAMTLKDQRRPNENE